MYAEFEWLSQELLVPYWGTTLFVCLFIGYYVQLKMLRAIMIECRCYLLLLRCKWFPVLTRPGRLAGLCMRRRTGKDSLGRFLDSFL